MGNFDKILKGLCPNDCGELTKIKKPIPIWQLLPMEALEGVGEYLTEQAYEEFENTSLTFLCSECGFALTSLNSGGKD